VSSSRATKPSIPLGGWHRGQEIEITENKFAAAGLSITAM